jgi:hypothetical protein
LSADRRNQTQHPGAGGKQTYRCDGSLRRKKIFPAHDDSLPAVFGKYNKAILLPKPSPKTTEPASSSCHDQNEEVTFPRNKSELQTAASSYRSDVEGGSYV